MLRSDAQGLFWTDLPKFKPPKKEKPKRNPPPKVWEDPAYLPNLEAAQALVLDEFTDEELWLAAMNKEQLVYDIEVYPNYVLFAFRSIQSHKCICLEISAESYLDTAKLLWIVQNFELITFNGIKFDLPITAIACDNHSTESIYEAVVMIIVQERQASDILKHFGVKKIRDVNQIDLIELTPLAPGLKVCAGRLHAKLMQELPFTPGTYLSREQALIVKWYCFNDLDNTELLFHSLKEPLQIRIETGRKYDIDLRSRSDAQMAEDIIGAEIRRLTGQRHIKKNIIAPGTRYKYKTPAFIKYQSELFNYALGVIQNAEFEVADDNEGGLIAPPEMKDLVLNINKCSYKFGIGGLHSQEEAVAHISDSEYLLIDTDVTSYYPFLILNAGLVPAALGQLFLQVYRRIVNDRVHAKANGLTILAECLKIVINGTFGKLGNKWSIMYAPDLLLQVTVTGQLCIAMLIERFEMAGIEVTSVNTDGIVVKCHRSMEWKYKEIVKQWEKETGLSTEETRYKATYSANINNYFAIYETPQKGQRYKAKGIFAKTSSKKHADKEICNEAAIAYLLDRISLNKTIYECKDIRKFTTMRRVKGGGVKVLANGGYEYLGKICRWYYGEGETTEIISALSGNKVAGSDGARPCMNLPDQFPSDINYEWYVEKTEKFLRNVGCVL